MSQILESVRRRAQETPEQTAFQWRAGRMIERRTCLETWEEIQNACRRYQKLKGRRVGILGGNSYWWITTAWAMAALESTTAFLDPVLNEADLKNAISRTELEALICDEDSWELGTRLRDSLPGLTLVSGEEEVGSQKTQGSWNPDVDHDVIFFTSGTTKNSKAVVTSASAVEENALCLLRLFRCGEKDLVYIPVPYHHAFGFSMLAMFFCAGCPIMLGSARSVLRDIRVSEPQILVAVPNLLIYLLDKQALSSGFMKNIMVAGGVCTKELAGRVLELGICIQNHYGSSEFSGGIAINLPGDPVDAMTPHEMAEVKLKTDGEVLVKGPFLMKEYYGMPKETQEIFQDGYLKTGDMGILDEHGRLHLSGRKKDTLVLESGEKIFYPDVDVALSALAGVRKGAVLSCANTLVAVLSPEPGIGEAELWRALEQYNQTQPFHRRMKKLWVYPGELPYTSTGKLKRQLLEEEYRHVH